MPAALLYVGLIALVFAVVPRLTITLGWGLLGIGLVIGQFGGLLKFPDWARDASPFTHTPAVPVVDFDWSAGSHPHRHRRGARGGGLCRLPPTELVS